MSLRTLCSQLWQRKALRLGLVTLLLFGALLVLAARHAVPVTHASGGGGGGGPTWPIWYIHTATPANSGVDFTRLDNLSLNTFPNVFLIVTPNVNTGGSGGVYDNHPIGVFYSAPYWYIFNQDGTPIQSGAAFNVYATLPYNYAGYEGAFVQTATSANSTYDYTSIDEPGLDGQPNKFLWVTPNWNPGGASVGVYNNHPIGVFYNTSTGHWCIFNQDKAPILAGAAFNVLFSEPPAPPSGNNEGLQTVTNTNSIANVTIINDPLLNENPRAHIFVMPVWNPGGSLSGVYENHNIGLYYNTYSGNWWIINQDSKPMPIGAAFFYFDM